MTSPHLNHSPPLQFYTDIGIGLSLAKVTALKRLRSAKPRQSLPLACPQLAGDVLNDIIALGSTALIAHLDQLLAKSPVHVIQESQTVTRIRVCGALDYVIDRSQRKVWTEPAPLSAKERRSAQPPPWHHTLDDKCYAVDLLKVLCKPMWLNYVAARPGWFGCTFSHHGCVQQQLFIKQNEMEYALAMVVRTTWQYFKRDKAFIALRHSLASQLTLHLGAGVVNLAMRSRLRTDTFALDARHMSLVLRHQPAFETMGRENPKLLPALTAWLMNADNSRSDAISKINDALPYMRYEVLAAGLPPRAWRYLAQHGFKRLQPHRDPAVPWKSMLHTLQAMDVAQWPPLPPRGFLRLLNDTAGHPLYYLQTCYRSGAGWFWQLACLEAHARRGDTAAYSDLFDQLPEWAWMVRHYQLQPDKNQRRKGIEWLEFMSDVVQSRLSQHDAPEWALWLPADGWPIDDDHNQRLKIVPLQSLGALRQEAFALHNCTDSFEDCCRAETHVLISLRSWTTNKVFALASFEKRRNWELSQVAGPCNTAVQPWVKQVAQQAAVWVRYHHFQQPKTLVETAAPSQDATKDDIHMLFMDI